MLCHRYRANAPDICAPDRTRPQKLAYHSRIAEGPTQSPHAARAHSPGLTHRPRRAAPASFARSRREAAHADAPPRRGTRSSLRLGPGTRRPSRATPGPRGGGPFAARRWRPRALVCLGAGLGVCPLGLGERACAATLEGRDPRTRAGGSLRRLPGGGASRRRGARGRLRRPLKWPAGGRERALIPECRGEGRDSDAPTQHAGPHPKPLFNVGGLQSADSKCSAGKAGLLGIDAEAGSTIGVCDGGAQAGWGCQASKRPHANQETVTRARTTSRSRAQSAPCRACL
jgi:hypothetical protein